MSTWKKFFDETKEKEYSKSLHEFLNKEYSSYTCYPPRKLMFNAFDKTEFDNVKVVIIGQDPYHEPNQAMGMSFSVPEGVDVPPSLINIYKEIENEYGYKMNYHSGDLTYLANQGVLLLNAILSVRAHMPLSHNIKEYKMFLSDTLRYLEQSDKPIVYLLWGGNARKLKSELTNPNHLVLESVHPSPLSANRGGWFGNNHFKLANEYLEKNGVEPIDWQNK